MRTASMAFFAGAILAATGAAGQQKQAMEGFVAGSGDAKAIYDSAGLAKWRVLEAENGEKPAVCPEDAFFEAGKDLLTSCTQDASYRLIEPEPGAVLPTGQPYPESAKKLIPWPWPDEGDDITKPPPGAAPSAP